MRSNALFRPVWNLNKLAKSDKEALLQIAVRFIDGSRMLISTGIYLSPQNFDKKTRQITGTGIDAKLNKQVADLIGDLRSAELEAMERKVRFDQAYLRRHLSGQKTDGSFIQFFKQALARKKSQYATSTYGLHSLVISQLEALHIIKFSDLTVTQLLHYDETLHDQGLSQTTIHKRHQVLSQYINEAIAEGYMSYDDDPYLRMKIRRGKSKIRTRLDDVEIQKLFDAEITDPDLDLCRDLYLFQCLTTISYKDLLSLNTKQLRRDGDMMWMEGLRKKSGGLFNVPLLPEAEKIVEKYKGKAEGGKVFPAPAMYAQNRRLKILAASVGISKNLTTHTGRHTGATWYLRRGLSKEMLQSVMGHSTVRTTEIYAVLERQMLKEAIQKIKKPG